MNLACIRTDRVVFQNLSFAVSPGEVLHLAGPNGAGKTSLLRMMAGALPIYSGNITWEGADFLESGMGEHAKRFSFLQAHDKSLKILETAIENLLFWTGVYGIAVPRCQQTLQQMGLAALADIPVRRLSSGQRRRLSLARAFLPDVPLWLFDEPLNGLDSEAKSLFATALDAHCAKGGMAVIASHLPVEPPAQGRLHRLEVGA